MRLFGLALVVTLPVTAQARQRDSTQTIAIERVTLLPLESAVTVPGQTVLIRGGRIVTVGSSSTARIPPGAFRIDGRGKYLMAGLADMHAHISRRDFPIFLANGVTMVREMNGSPQHLAWRDSVERGLLLGPSLSVSSPLLAGVPQRYRHQVITSVEAAVAAVKDARQLGYDAIKVYDGLSPEVYQALALEAKRAGLPLTGHIPAAVGLDGVVQQGQHSIEHTDQILSRLNGHPPDSAEIARAADLLATGRVWVTPTLAVFERLSLLASDSVQSRFNRPEMTYVDSATMAWWQTLRRPNIGAPSDRAIRMANAHRYLVNQLAVRGVPILVGTDTPNPLMVPGFSLHEELEALEAAGLTRLALLRSATREAAEFLGKEKEFGKVEPGYRADLLLLEANPLEQLETLRRPAGVMVRGRWLSRPDLDQMLRR